MNPEPDKTSPAATGRRLWRRVLKWIMGTVIILVAIIGLTLGAVVWILTPQKLTPMVERYTSRYLDADVTVRRVELTVWSTFPQVRLDVDSLTIVSRTLSTLTAGQRATLPAYADTLLQVEALTGGINLARLAIGEIDLHHVEIVRPTINLIQATSEVANYTIMPPSTDDSKDEPSGDIPDITIDRFTIVGDAPVRYLSVPDSIDVTLTLTSTGINGGDATRPYEVSFSGRSWFTAGTRPLLADFRIGIDGCVHWSARTPQSVRLTDFNVDLDSIHTTVDTDLDMADPMTIHTASLTIAPTPVMTLLHYLPEDMRSDFDGLQTDLTVSVGATLKAPYKIGKDLIPSAAVTVTIPDGSASWLGYRLDRAGMEIAADIDGSDPNASTIDVTRLDLNGSGVAVGLHGRITCPLSDPMVAGRFEGKINFSSLPRALTRKLPMRLSGLLAGNTDFRLRNSNLNRNSFHRAYLDGKIDLRRFGMVTADSMNIYIGDARLSFGTNSKFSAGAVKVDSLLTASLKVDTASLTMPDLELIIAGVSVGMGSRNTASSTDTTVINPIGGNISVNRLDYRSLTDSVRVRMRDIQCGALLRRFQGKGRVPQLGLKATAGRMAYGDGLTRMSVSDGEFAVTAHLNPRPKLPARMQARYDSIATANPGAGSDSIAALMIDLYRKRHRDVATEQLDLAVDNSIGRILRRWNVRGGLTAQSGRMVTPYFPLRNRIRDLDLRFTTDSVCLNSFHLTSGGSDLALTGNITNIRRALTSRRGSPLKIRFAIDSDTLNVNQITRAVFMGAAFGEHTDSLRETITGEVSEDELQSRLENSTDSTGTLLIPTNIDAELTVNADHILYSDMLLNKLRGSVLVYDGALKLQDLSARTDMGSLDLTALYSARTKRDINFGFSLGVHDFNIERFTALMPVVDSLLPLMRDFRGIINADVVATTAIDSIMNIDLPTLHAAIKLTGDSLVVLDRETFRTLSKWLMFKNKQRNMIDHMEVELTVNDSQLELYPFMFDIDRYRLGVMGGNDLALNLNYHISVLKSPLPFKFGINIKGTADDMKIRVGKARFKENMAAERTEIAETTRVNLLNEIEKVFRRGVNAARLGPLGIRRPANFADAPETDTLSHADSIAFAKEGLIEMPADTVPDTIPIKTKKRKK